MCIVLYAKSRQQWFSGLENNYGNLVIGTHISFTLLELAILNRLGDILHFVRRV